MLSAQPIRRKKTTAVVNPRRKSSGAPRRKNPVAAATLLLGQINPRRKPVQKKKNSSKKHYNFRRKANPMVKASSKKAASIKARPIPRRRNPNFNSILSRPVELLKSGAFGALSYFATRQVPQFALKTRNVSYVGYIANALTALACAAGADKFFGPDAGKAAFVGGGMALVSRVVNDQTSLGAQLNLSGIGDPHAAALGRLRGRGVGTIVPGYWAQPPVIARDGSPVIPQQMIDAVKAQIPPAAVPVSTGTAGIGRFSGRV